MKQSLINFSTTILATTGITIVSANIFFLNVEAQSLPLANNSVLVAQKLGKIEKKIDLSDIPITVLSSARAVSGGEPTKAQVQVNPDGSLVYELGGQNQQGFDFEIDINSDGEIIEIDEQVEASAVPEKVMKAFKYWLPNAKVASIWRSTRYETFNYYYELVIDDGFWIEIPADGSTVKINPPSQLVE